MPLFPNAIDKKFLKQYGNMLYPDFLYKKKYTSFFKKKKLLDSLSVFSDFHDEEKLNQFINYCNKSKQTLDLTNVFYFDQQFVDILNLGIPISLAIKLISSSVLEHIELLKKNFTMDFIEENLFSLQNFLTSPQSIEFLNREDITKEQKEFIILHADFSKLFSDLSTFGIDFLCQYNDYVSSLRTFAPCSYFEKMKDVFLATQDKDKFVKEILVITQKFQRSTTDVIVNAYLENLDCFSYLEELTPAVDLFPSFINQLVVRKDIPFYRNLLLQYASQQDVKLFLDFQMEMPINKILEAYSLVSNDGSVVQKYGTFINLLTQIKDGGKEKQLELFNQLLDVMGDTQSFLNEFYENTVIENFKQNIFDVHDEKSLEKYPHSTITYKDKEIEVITIDDYPFTLLVSGLESKSEKFQFGTTSISQQIVKSPELWMDMSVTGSDMISMSRINEAYFMSWGATENGVICGFSNIRENQIVSHANADAATSMEAKEANVSKDMDSTVLNLPNFDKRDCKYFNFDASQYEEIRANRYLKNADGTISKYPPDYMVEKSHNKIKDATLEWAYMYGNKIVRFDYDKISYKAQKEFLESVQQLQNGSVSFSIEAQKHINYLYHIMIAFATEEDRQQVTEIYFAFLKNLALTTTEDISFVFQSDLDDSRFKEIYQLWQSRLQQNTVLETIENYNDKLGM